MNCNSFLFVSPIYLLSFLFLIDYVFSLRNVGNTSDLFVPDYETYNYKLLKHKMAESMSINQCLIYGFELNLSSKQGGTTDPSKADLIVETIQPNHKLLSIWEHSDGIYPYKIYSKASANLCSTKYFDSFKRGDFRRGKGCYEMTFNDSNGQKRKRINRYAATLHPDHIRCDIANSISVCYTAGKENDQTGIVQIDSKYRSLSSYPFFVKTKNAIIAKSGMLVMNCGVFGLLSSCEAVNWGVHTAKKYIPDVITCQTNNCPYPTYQKVFIMSQYDDTQIGQFMMESFPRLVMHLDYLQENPDIMIHFGFTKQPSVPRFTLPNMFLNWLGFQDRMINGTIYANEVIMSREGGCQDAGYNAWEIINMRNKFFTILSLPAQNSKFIKKTIVILSRSSGTKFVQNKGDGDVRKWPKGFLDKFIISLNEKFPKYEIKLFSDTNSTLMTCPSCQIQLFHSANIVIGIHGAGLTNTMYMKPGGLVVELLPYYDSRHAPIVGIFPRLSDIIGLNHYSYYIRDTILNAETLTNDIYDYYHKVNLWSE